MKKRAADGCNFCAFLRNSLLSEYSERRGYLGDDKQSVWVIITTNITETMVDKSALLMYKRNGSHVLQVQV